MCRENGMSILLVSIAVFCPTQTVFKFSHSQTVWRVLSTTYDVENCSAGPAGSGSHPSTVHCSPALVSPKGGAGLPVSCTCLCLIARLRAVCGSPQGGGRGMRGRGIRFGWVFLCPRPVGLKISETAAASPCSSLHVRSTKYVVYPHRCLRTCLHHDLCVVLPVCSPPRLHQHPLAPASACPGPRVGQRQTPSPSRSRAHQPATRSRVSPEAAPPRSLLHRGPG